MATYLSRSAWTTTAASGATLTGFELVGVAVHWPGTTQSAIGDPGQASIASRLRSYRDFHVNTRGWRDIGYTFAIDQGGRVWQLRTTTWHGNLVGAHCASASNPRANHKYVGVLLILGQSEQPSAAMIEAFRDWYHTRFLPVWKGRTDVRGHGQVPGAQTNCPGTRAKTLIGNGTLTHQPTEPPEDSHMSAADVAELKKYIDAKVPEVARAVQERSVQVGLDAEPLGLAVGRTRAGLRRMEAAQLDVASLAAQLAPLLPSGLVATQEQLEAALRNVLGSLDES